MPPWIMRVVIPFVAGLVAILTMAALADTSLVLACVIAVAIILLGQLAVLRWERRSRGRPPDD